MEQIDMLPQQSLQTIANWGTAFLARPTQEKEFVQLYGKPLYQGAIAFSKWWRSLSIGQLQTVNQINFPYWTLTLARKLAKVPLKKLDDCLGALQKTQLSISKLSHIVNKFIPKAKLGFGRIITESDWSLIASAFELTSDGIDEIRQLALRTNGASAQSVTTDDVIEILRERGYQVEQLLPKPRVKRYSLPEVEQLIGIKVQEVLQDRKEHLLAAIEHSRYLEAQNERLINQLRSIFGSNGASPSQCSTTVEITPITEEELEQPDVFEECLELWKVSFSVRSREDRR
ncbi:hypothetical protein HC931_27760 [Candidatus Gracilibacteria bacterium]|nr:hypothetical protein [Candidatus Gracilibacteria bacterium]